MKARFPNRNEYDINSLQSYNRLDVMPQLHGGEPYGTTSPITHLETAFHQIDKRF